MALRWGIVGVAGIGSSHAQALKGMEGVELYAACDVVPDALERFCAEFNVPHRFTDFTAFLRSEVEVVSICTPHFLHAEQAIAALEAGKHVLCEKPMAISVREADAMIAAAKKAKGKAGVVFQHRLDPPVRVIKRLLPELGELVRGLYQGHHFRTQAYYEQGRWRGTWWGEGGGVLINQAIHDLDTLAYLLGLPMRVTARIANFGHDNTEVEDMASAIWEWDNGAHFVMHISSVAYAVPSRLEITGDNGTAILEGGAVRLGRYEPPLRRFLRESPEAWGRPKVEWSEVPVDKDVPKGHAAAIRAFAQAILTGNAPPVPFEEGIKSLELMNAIVLSHFSGQPVTLPVDRNAYEALLDELKQGNKRLQAR
ncbi:Glucose--fructose oxidoreductase [bacterium HR17]|uniref:Glucose--fructose oxidoreductase n=1 Tax=Candidatus Fervidibacter japonicus TaxID=2035412 RepID=A0A2H5X9E6_9BACT|nr:Glucose--fructose oxidoreductase [bacterium HR17]